jgi:ribosomal protein S18 acetylase RimI-like enzyme
MDIEIRKATIDDVPKVLLLGNTVEEFATSDHEDIFWPESVLRKSIESDEVIFLVAIQKNRVVGFTIVNCNHALSKALIENTYVTPDARGKGIGTRLAQSSLKIIQDQGYRYISTLVSPENTAVIKMREKVGFQKGNVFLWLDFVPNNKH